MDIWEKIEYGLMFLCGGLILLLGFSNGLEFFNINYDLYFIAGRIVLLDALYSSLSFTFLILFISILLFRDVYSSAEIPYKKSGKEVVAIVPVYQDAEVMDDTVKSINNSEYSDLKVYVACEPDDERCIQKAKELECETIINSHPGSKAGAINTVFEEVDSDYYAIFDADEIVREDFIPQAVGYLEQGYEAFQGRRIPITGGLVENFAYCERALYHAFYQLMHLTGFYYIKSSSTVLTKDVWEDVDGYDDMLTEDIDFTHKCYRQKINLKSDRRVANKMEAPHNWKDFWGQRKRWSKGNIQVMHKALKGGYQTNWSFRGISSTARVVMGVFAPIYIIGLISKIILLIFFDLKLGYIIPITVTALPALILSVKDRDETEFVGLYSLLTFFAAVISGFLRIKALAEYTLSWDGDWYRVEKEGVDSN